MKKCQCLKCGKVFKLRKDGSFSRWALNHACKLSFSDKIRLKLGTYDVSKYLQIIDDNKESTSKIDKLHDELTDIKIMIKTLKLRAPTASHLRPPPGFPPKRLPGHQPPVQQSKEMKAMREVMREMRDMFKKVSGDISKVLKEPNELDANDLKQKTPEELERLKQEFWERKMKKNLSNEKQNI